MFLFGALVNYTPRRVYQVRPRSGPGVSFPLRLLQGIAKAQV